MTAEEYVVNKVTELEAKLRAREIEKDDLRGTIQRYQQDLNEKEEELSRIKREYQKNTEEANAAYQSLKKRMQELIVVRPVIGADNEHVAEFIDSGYIFEKHHPEDFQFLMDTFDLKKEEKNS